MKRGGGACNLERRRWKKTWADSGNLRTLLVMDHWRADLARHMTELETCRRCAGMQSAPVVAEFQPAWRQGGVLLLGQAPGVREPGQKRLFAWTAGKTLFRWFQEGAGADEALFRERVYMAATCRCFPGKAKSGGGDRAPNREEMAACTPWLERELELLQPGLILAIGRLAITRFLEAERLEDVIGKSYSCRLELPGGALTTDILPLPHPSGASTWHRREPGLTLLGDALEVLRGHPVWRETFPEVLS